MEPEINKIVEVEVNRIVEVDALIKELEPENLPKQYFFGTRQALSKLHFKKVRREIVG